VILQPALNKKNYPNNPLENWLSGTPTLLIIWRIAPQILFSNPSEELTLIIPQIGGPDS